MAQENNNGRLRLEMGTSSLFENGTRKVENGERSRRQKDQNLCQQLQ